MNTYVAIDIGGTNIKYGLINASSKLIESHEIPTEAYKGGPGILQKVEDIISRYKEKHEIKGICLSSAGMVDPEKGEIFYSGPQIPNYAGTQFKKILEEKFGVPTEIENDVNCAGLAEAISGSAKDSQYSVCLTIGTGIGGCLILDKKVFHGYSNSACEVGYLHLEGDSFQNLASTTALVEYVAQKHGEDKKDWNGKRIFKEAQEGNQICIEGIDRMVHYLAQGIANICYVINPQVVVLGGGIMSQEKILKPKLIKALKENLVSSLSEKTSIAFAHYKNTAGMMGAYYNFLERQLD